MKTFEKIVNGLQLKYQEKRELLLKVLGHWETALKYPPHFMFMEPESINFTLEKLSRTQMLNKGKKQTNKQTKSNKIKIKR